MKITRVVAAVAVTAGAISCMHKIDARNLFADLTYDDSDASSPASVVPFQLYATLETEALVPWAKPEAIASCLTALTPGVLQDAANELTKQQVGSPLWGREAWRFANKQPCFQAVADEDKVMAAYVFARVASDVWATARDATATDAGATAVSAASHAALVRVAAILNQKHPNQTSQTSDASLRQAPALALSGGAANGAFSAGFLAELLSVRLRALENLPAGKARDDAAKATRFNVLVGTSVGAVLSQIIDAYYLDDPAVYTANQAFFDDCNGFWKKSPATPQPQQPGTPVECFNGWKPDDGNVPSTVTDAVVHDYPVQACAIRYLYKLTEVEEQDLICSPSGPVTTTLGILGPNHPGLVRFDPMGKNIVDPFVGRFASPMMNNDITRVLVSVETVQNQTLGLDERACWGLPSTATSTAPLKQGSSENCLASGVMASLVLPFFAIPVRHTYSGWSPAGECGAWLDGGLRSGFPALRALQMTRPNATDPNLPQDKPAHRLRVIAVNNGQADGQAHQRPQRIDQVALNAIGQLSGQVEMSEMVLAQQQSALRERAVRAINDAKAAGPSVMADAGAADADAGTIYNSQAVPVASDDDEVSAVWVPNEVAPSIISGSEYSFDKYIMRGLFVWGRRMAMKRLTEQLASGPTRERNRRELARWLGWTSLADDMVKEATNDLTNAAWVSWTKAYEHEECFPFHVKRSHAGTARIIEKMPVCGGLTDPLVEPYFQCKSPATEVR